jgi:hypothetical protein
MNDGKLGALPAAYLCIVAMLVVGVAGSILYPWDVFPEQRAWLPTGDRIVRVSFEETNPYMGSGYQLHIFPPDGRCPARNTLRPLRYAEGIGTAAFWRLIELHELRETRQSTGPVIMDAPRQHAIVTLRSGKTFTGTSVAGEFIDNGNLRLVTTALREVRMLPCPL